MSSEQLVGDFLDGQISRRTLIRRLVATGVSVGAAVSYAHLLRPGDAEAKAGPLNDHYAPDLVIRSKTTEAVVKKDKLKVRVATNFAEKVTLHATVRHKGKAVRIASATTHVPKLGHKVVSMHLNSRGHKLLSRHDKIRVTVTGKGTDGYHQAGTSTAAKRLT